MCTGKLPNSHFRVLMASGRSSLRVFPGCSLSHIICHATWRLHLGILNEPILKMMQIAASASLVTRWQS